MDLVSFKADLIKFKKILFYERVHKPRNNDSFINGVR